MRIYRVQLRSYLNVKPYYEQSGIVIYHGSALTVLDEFDGLRTQTFDLLLTDPPYGIGLDTKRTRQWKAKSEKWPGARLTNDYGLTEWDEQPAHEAITLARRLCRWSVIFGGNFYELPPASCWLVWDKENGANTFADAELAWTNLPQAVRIVRYLWNGFQKELPEERLHPTQKPEAVVRWALMQAPESVRTVLDPFMGSGTTLVAAKRLGRSCVGIEREERYCEIAARRLSQEVLPLTELPEAVDAVDPVGRLDFTDGPRA